MNEEIKVTFGGDLTPLGTSLRSLNKMVKEAGKEAKENIKEGFGGLGEILGGGAILEGMRHVIDKFDELDKRAKNLGVGTDFLQGMEHISSTDAIGGVETFNKAIGQLSVNLGEAKDGSEEAIKKFAKWGITLKDIQDLDAEGMFYKISDRIKDIEDPSKRSAAAFDLLGKAGKNLTGVMSEGSDAVKKMVDQVDKLDADKIKELAEAKKSMEGVVNTATVWAGKALGAVGSVGHTLGNWSMGDFMGSNDAQDALRAKLYPKGAASTAQGTDMGGEYSTKLLEAKDKWMAANAKTLDNKSQLTALIFRQHDLEKEISSSQGESVEKYKKMTELAETSKNIKELEAKITKEADEKREKALKKEEEFRKKDLEITTEIENTRKNIAYNTMKREQDRMAPYLPSLEELSNSGYSFFGGNHWNWQQGPFAQQARQLLNLQGDAKQSLIWGNKDRFNQDVSKIDELKKALTSAGVMSPDETLQSIDKTLSDSKDHLQVLMEKATGDGINVKGQDD